MQCNACKGPVSVVGKLAWGQIHASATAKICKKNLFSAISLTNNTRDGNFYDLAILAIRFLPPPLNTFHSEARWLNPQSTTVLMEALRLLDAAPQMQQPMRIGRCTRTRSYRLCFFGLICKTQLQKRPLQNIIFLCDDKNGCRFNT